MTTTFAKPNDVKRRWLLIDAQGKVLGRLASRIALILRGKHKALFTPYIDCGDFVVVINAEKIVLTGLKLTQEVHQWYSGYPGGRTEQPLSEVIKTHPDRIIRRAVKGMLPEGPLGRRLLKKLKIYRGTAHPHGAQEPAPVAAALIGRE